MSVPTADYSEHLRALFQCAVAAANPLTLVPAALPVPPRGRLLILSIGKAAAEMAHAACANYQQVESLSISGVLSGVRGAQLANGQRAQLIGDWQVFQGGHPVPNAQSLAAGDAIRKLIKTAGPDDLLLALISGGGSAMLEVLNPGIELSDLLVLNQALLRSGWDIAALNQCRVQFSAIKAGRLLADLLQQGVSSVTLLLSDVPDGAPHLIASGPSLAWLPTRHEVLLPADLDPRLAARLRNCATPVPVLPAHPAHHWQVLCTPTDSLKAAAALARTQAWPVLSLGAALGGEAQALGREHAKQLLAYAARGEAVLMLSGGETSVSTGAVSAQSRGGRNSEYLLAVLQHLAQSDPAALVNSQVYGLAADSDGIDGSGPEAGAQFSPTTLQRARANPQTLQVALREHNALNYFAQYSQALNTGPTGTNVNDFRALWLLPKP